MTEKKSQVCLTDAITELSKMDWYIEKATEIECDAYIDADILKLLIGMAKAKLRYFDRKYGFTVDDEDYIFLGNAVDFIKKLGAEEAARMFEKKGGYNG